MGRSRGKGSGLRGALRGGKTLLHLVSKFLDLPVGNLESSLQIQIQVAATGVFELYAFEDNVILHRGRQGGLEISPLLDGMEQRVANLLPQLVAQRAGAEKFSQRSLGLDTPYRRYQAQRRSLVHGGSGFELESAVAASQRGGPLRAELRDLLPGSQAHR